jgi:colicin import membrane protein
LQTKSHTELKNEAKGRTNGFIGTILVHAGLFSLLILVSFSSPPLPQEEEGILVNFGTGETGLGLVEPSPPPGEKVVGPPPAVEVKAKPVNQPKQTPSKVKEDSYLTEDNKEDAPAVKKAVTPVKPDPEAAKKRQERLEEEKRIKEEKEAERLRIKQEEAEKQRIAAEQAREADIMNRTKNALANSKNTGTSSTSEGIAGGTGNQGDPRGSIYSTVRGAGGGLGDSGNGTGGPGGTGKGVSYNLGGRGVQSLPLPKYDYQEGGKVVVEVTVDRDGNVSGAVAGIKGSTTLDADLLRIAKEAALKAKFEVKHDAPPAQKGTITYDFKLK